MEKDACFQLGYVSKTHGTNGQLVIQLDVDQPEQYKTLESIFLDTSGGLIPFFVEQAKLQGDKVTLKLEDIDSLPQAEELKGCAAFLPLSMLPPLADDQFYFHEIIGFKILNEKQEELGIVKDVYNLPHQDLIAMYHQGKEVLIPMVDEFLLKVRKKESILELRLPDGLLDV